MREDVEFSRAIAMPSEIIIAIPHPLMSLLWFRVRDRAALELELVAPHAPTDDLGKRCRPSCEDPCCVSCRVELPPLREDL
jgi:hypothetical protein